MNPPQRPSASRESEATRSIAPTFLRHVPHARRHDDARGLLGGVCVCRATGQGGTHSLRKFTCPPPQVSIEGKAILQALLKNLKLFDFFFFKMNGLSTIISIINGDNKILLNTDLLISSLRAKASSHSHMCSLIAANSSQLVCLGKSALNFWRASRERHLLKLLSLVSTVMRS